MMGRSEMLPITEHQRTILEMIRSEALSAPSIANALRHNRNSVRAVLEKLTVRGLVRKHQTSFHDIVWSLSEAGAEALNQVPNRSAPNEQGPRSPSSGRRAQLERLIAIEDEIAQLESERAEIFAALSEAGGGLEK